jgi:hypothetical protein
VGEEDERDLGVAEDGELVRLLEQAVPALGEGHLPADLVLDPLQHHLPAPHGALPDLSAFLPLRIGDPSAISAAFSLATSRRYQRPL